MILLTADWHLTDNPQDDYRWDIFDVLKEIISKEKTRAEIFILGDLCDRKDRHSSVLVNALTIALLELRNAGANIYILRGNHDSYLDRVPYWDWLNNLEDIYFIDKPITWNHEVELLPYSANPNEDWKDLNLQGRAAVFFHQTVNGAITENGTKLESELVLLPSGPKYYSGDIHVPQKVGAVTYVGAPHPVRFGDNYPCRILSLSDDYSIKKEIYLDGIKKHVIEISSIEELEALEVNEGDQARIRFTIPTNKLEQWPVDQEYIRQWAAEKGVALASIETTMEYAEKVNVELSASPEETLKSFAASEGVSDELLAEGLTLLKQS